PLDSGDRDDLRIKAGETVRVNLVYFDAFQLPITKTRVGGIYGAHLDRADAWGTLRLAAGVKNDGGVAFENPPWIKAMAQSLAAASSSRLKVTDANLIAGSSPPAAKFQVSFTFPDINGERREAKAKIYLNASAGGASGVTRSPLLFSAG